MTTWENIEEIDASVAAADVYRPTHPVDNSQPPPTSLSSVQPPTTLSTTTNRLLLTPDINSSLRMTNWESVEEIDASDATIATAAGYRPTPAHSSVQQRTSGLQPPPATGRQPTTVTWSNPCVPPSTVRLQRLTEHHRSASNPSLSRCILQQY